MNTLFVDIKATAQRDPDPRFAFTLSNRNAHQANAYLFVRLMETQDGSMNAMLMGWSHARDVWPIIRRSDKYPHLGHVRLSWLRRHGVLYPVSHLLLSNTAKL